jgi:hypothetical protein
MKEQSKIVGGIKKRSFLERQLHSISRIASRF